MINRPAIDWIEITKSKKSGVGCDGRDARCGYVISSEVKIASEIPTTKNPATIPPRECFRRIGQYFI
jgi:hypothetical protein